MGFYDECFFFRKGLVCKGFVKSTHFYYCCCLSRLARSLAMSEDSLNAVIAQLKSELICSFLWELDPFLSLSDLFFLSVVASAGRKRLEWNLATHCFLIIAFIMELDIHFCYSVNTRQNPRPQSGIITRHLCNVLNIRQYLSIRRC